MAKTFEEQMIEVGGRLVRLEVRRHRRARRASLRLMHSGEGLVLTLPLRGSLPKALAFVQQKSGWVLSRLAEVPEAVAFSHGAVIPVLGEPHAVHWQQGRGLTRIKEGRIEVFGAQQFTRRRVKDALKMHLQAACQQQAELFANHLNVQVKALRIGEMRSRWGSCTASGRLAFNWRLVFAPASVVAYLVAHEVAHLREMNHSPRFWQLVASLCPHYMQAKAWLRQNGQGLGRFG